MQHHKIMVTEKIQETPTTVSLKFGAKISILPGQFIMVTDFINGEKPFSISEVTEDTFTMTIRSLGQFSKTLNELSVGSVLYYRGPYGNNFTIPGTQQKIIIVGGGCGTGPLRYLIDSLLKKANHSITLINGAKTASELLFKNLMGKFPIKIINVTDDGSFGEMENSGNALSKLLLKNNFDFLYTAGPELMMKSVYDIAQNNNLQGEFLLERYMKCGNGICGSCVMDPIGIRICVEGPVISTETLGQINEFGIYHREASGARGPLISCDVYNI